MWGANEGVIPSQIFDQSFPYEALVTNAYAGRSVKVKNVTPFTWHSDMANGEPQILANPTACYLVFITAAVAAAVTWSVAGKDNIVSTGLALSGKMIFFDAIQVTSGGDSPYQVFGFKIDIEGSTSDPVSSASLLAPGFNVQMRLNGFRLRLTEVLINGTPTPWNSQSSTEFTLQQTDLTDGSPLDQYIVDLLLPKIEGVDPNLDYAATGTYLMTFGGVGVGANWQMSGSGTGMVGAETVLIRSTPPVGFGLVQNAIDVQGGNLSVTNVLVSTVPVVGAGFPATAGQYKSFSNVSVTAVELIRVVVAGTVGTTVRLLMASGAITDQPFTVAGNYDFAGVDLSTEGFTIIVF